MRSYALLSLIFIVLCTSFVIIVMAATTSQMIEVFASSGLNVYVSLFNDGGQAVKICVFTVEESAGCQTYSPSEYNLHRLGPFTFSPGAVAVGERFTACASIEGASDVCSDGYNGEQNTLERVTIKIPSTGGQQQPIGPQGGRVNTIPTQPRSDSWSDICQTIQPWLVNNCSAYFNPDGSENSEGVRAKTCILGSVLLSGLAVGLSEGTAPIGMIIDGLSVASSVTGCQDIIDFVKLKATTDPSTLLSAIGISRTSSGFN
jgi:hypothetical protein